ncbi:AAA family ATPase [Sulfitobacter sp. BSw21498]|uniref:AAA family ATPase n=1 Tax=Sulfitobacter sp. BSw21498 TaxID=664426 RepID=UPI001110C2B1|nr:AAA family ATPase [Sulfitobacter sp. BSw21498]
MSFVNRERIALLTELKAPHFEFPREAKLRSAFERCVEEYLTAQQIGGLEVRGLLVTGQSRIGKSRELNSLIRKFNESETLMPNGRPAKIVSCLLSGQVTFKDLGIKTLRALGYDLHRTRTQEYIWKRVVDQAERQGVIGVHYDECQHVFIDGAKSNKIFLDSFKSMMKERHWPMMLILSGVPTLSNYIRSYEQLEKLVDPVHFDEIRLKRDSDQLVKLLYCYADRVEMNIDELVTPDFLARLDHACSHRWGLVIELLIKTLVEVKLSGKNELEVNDFAVQFAAKTGTLMRSSPFTAPDFLTAFDSQRLFEINS